MAGNNPRRVAMNTIAETLREFSQKFEEEYSMHINSLPDELLLRIFQHVDMEERVDWVSRVCVRWERLCCDSVLWREVELEYQPGAHAFRKRMLRLAPCLKTLKLVLPPKEDPAFQERELYPLPTDISRVVISFARETVLLMLEALKKVLGSVRELEFLPLDGSDREVRLSARDAAHVSSRVLELHREARELSKEGYIVNVLPPSHVRRFWQVMQAHGGAVETLVMRGWTSQLLSRYSGCAMPGLVPELLAEGPLLSNLRNLVLLGSGPHSMLMGTGSSLSSPITTFSDFIRCQSETLRTVGVYGMILERRRDMEAALATCPELQHSYIGPTGLCYGYGLTISDDWETLEMTMPKEDTQISAFLSLPYVQSRVVNLHAFHNVNIWEQLKTWSGLRTLEIVANTSLELPRPLGEVLADLPKLEMLSICAGGEFIRGHQHLMSISPEVAPSLERLYVSRACVSKCVCAAAAHIRATFKNLKCVTFTCNKEVDNLLDGPVM